jgi:hypothetical protein
MKGITMSDWFTELTGLADDRPATVRAGIAVQGDRLLLPDGRSLIAGRLTSPALADLPAPPSGPHRLRVSEVVADVQDLHRDPENAGALFQVASQFNLLEMVGPHVTPDLGIARYAHDATQGPACAIACAAGTIYRNYLVPIAGQTGQTATRQLDLLADFGAALGERPLWNMVNGYLLPHPGGLKHIAHRLAQTDAAHLPGLVRVGLQQDTQVTLANTGHLVSQVYCSALPIDYANERLADWEPFARLILTAAYRATLAIALQNSARTCNRRLFLTRLGGGAFGNPPPWITEAIATALTAFGPADLDIRIVSYGHPNPANRTLLR